MDDVGEVEMDAGSSRAESAANAIVDEKYCFEEETHLTVHKTSVFVPGAGDGFVVYDSAGDIIFRVDSYGPDSAGDDELVLMDPSGKSLVTLLRKKPSLHQRWEGFLGEKMDDDEQVPIFSIFKSCIIGQFHVVAVVHSHDQKEDKEYHVEGSFGHRACCIYDETTNSEAREPVAQVKRKVDPDRNVMLGKDVFMLCLKPLVDAAFMMAVLMILDQIYGGDVDDDDDDSADEVHIEGLENDLSS